MFLAMQGSSLTAGTAVSVKYVSMGPTLVLVQPSVFPVRPLRTRLLGPFHANAALVLAVLEAVVLSVVVCVLSGLTMICLTKRYVYCAREIRTPQL